MEDPTTAIGLIAGDIWHFIDDKGGTSTLSEVLSSINYPKEFTLMGMGWLLREGQAFLEPQGKDFKVTIRK